MDEVEVTATEEPEAPQTPVQAYTPGPDPAEARPPQKSLLSLYGFLVCVVLSLGSLATTLFLFSEHLKRNLNEKKWDRNVEEINAALVRTGNLEELEKELKTAKAEIEGYGKGNKKIAEKMANLQVRTEKLNAKYARLEARLATEQEMFRAEKSELSDKLESLKQDLAEQTEITLVLKKKYARLEAKLAAEQEKFLAEKSELSDKLDVTEQERDAERKRFRAEQSELSDKLDATEKERDDARQRGDELKRRYEGVRANAENLREDLKKAADKLDRFGGQLESSRQDLVEEEKKRQELDIKYKVLGEQLEALEKENKELRGRIKELEKKDEGEPDDKTY